jgi:hypothetical protein
VTRLIIFDLQYTICVVCVNQGVIRKS